MIEIFNPHVLQYEVIFLFAKGAYPYIPLFLSFEYGTD